MGKIVWIFAIFILLRLALILTFPPFTDEADRIFWGQHMVISPQLRFASILYFREPPLAFWLFGLGSFLIQDPIIGARIIVLALSIPGFFLLYDLVKNLAGKRAGLFAILFYTFCPLFVFFQSMALVDTFLLSINTAIVWLIFKLKKIFKWQYLVLIAILLGISFWIKNTAVFMLIGTFLISGFLFKWRVLVLFPAVLAFILPLVLRDDFLLLVKKNENFALTLSEIFQFPFTIWIKNTLFFAWTFMIYLTPISLICILFIKKDFKKKWVVLCSTWFLLSIFPLIITSKFNEMRYYLFSFALLLPLFGLGADNLFKKLKWNLAVFSGIISILLVLLSIFLIARPYSFFNLFPKNSIVGIERDYATYWPSAYKIRETIDFFEKARPKNRQTILALVSNGSSTVSSYLGSYYRNDPEVKVVFFEMTKSGVVQIQNLAKDYPLYIIINSYFVGEDLAKVIQPLENFSQKGVETSILVADIKKDND